MNKITSSLRQTNVKALLAGLFTLLLGAYALDTLKSSTTHPIATSTDTEVHVHSDFRVYVGDIRLRFTDLRYQSNPELTHHASLHFHDGNDEVIHRHADGVTLTDFFDSIGMELTNDCFTEDTGTQHCTNETNSLLLLVNGERVTNITDYIINEEDRILLYYGDPADSNIQKYVREITEMACMYSGTCPEKGVPPTESCGLTCEVADLAKTESQGIIQTLKEWMAWW